MLDDRIGPEFLGQARVARSHYTAAAVVSGKEMRAIITGLENEYKRKGTAVALRTLQRAHQRWLAIGTDGCLTQTVTLNNRHLTITDVRVTGSTGRSSAWRDNGTEPGVVIIENRVAAGPKRMVWSAPILSSVAIHALGRWHHRAFRNDPASLHSDLQTLAAAAADVVAAGIAKVAATTTNGNWLGHLAQDEAGHVHVDVRTFH